MLAYLY